MTLHPDFTKLVVDALPAEVRELLISQGPSIMVAGGFVRDTLTAARPKDVDIFGIDFRALTAASDAFEKRDNYRRGDTENAITYKNEIGGFDVQMIVRSFNTSHLETLTSFDFTNVQAGVYHEAGEWFGICTEAFTRDLPAFALRFTSPPHNNMIGSLLRAFKFVSQGWKIDDTSIVTILGRLTKELDGMIALTTAAEEPEHIKRAQFALEMARKYPEWAVKHPASPTTDVSEDLPF